MTVDEALQLFSHLCAGSVAGALRALGLDVQFDTPEIVQPGVSPFADAPAPGIEASVELDEGLAGESILLLSEAAAERFAAAEEEGGAPAGDLDAVVGRVAVQAATAVASAAGRILEQAVPVGKPTTLRYDDVEAAGTSSETSPHAFAIALTVDGEPGRFVHRVQNALLIKAVPGLDTIAELGEAAATSGAGVPDDALRDVKVRVWAELGRARLPLAQAVSIPSGAVVQLDRSADDPVEVFVNGRLFAHGCLVVREDEWAVEIEELVGARHRGEFAFVVDESQAAAAVAAANSAPQPADGAADNSPR